MVARKLELVPRFDSGLGKETEPVADNLNESLLGLAPESALTTIAFIFGNVDPLRLSQFGVRTTMLALYAAGADVKLTRMELWELCSDPQRYAQIFNLPEHQGVLNGRLVTFVLNRAKQRGHREDIPCGSYLENIGFRLIRLQNATSCSARDSDDAVALRTIAFESLNPDPLRVTGPTLSVAMLATWAAGAEVKLPASQYQHLVRQANLNLHSGQVQCRAERIRFVLQKASDRAEQEELSQTRFVA